jgi:hypothetical protein
MGKSYDSYMPGQDRYLRLLLVVIFLWTGYQLIEIYPSSLWTDEIYTIENFSSKGSLVALTDYHVPNNHILFSFLNSILPGSSSYYPTRARAIPLTCLILSILFLWIWSSKANNYFIGATIALFLANEKYLELIIQARGYCIVSLVAIAQSYLLWLYFHQNRVKSLKWIAICSIAGTWVIPTYLLFAAPLHILLFLYKRARNEFLWGFVAASGIGLAYLPVLSELSMNMRTYEQEHGAHFSGVTDFFRVPREYIGFLALFFVPLGIVSLFSLRSSSELLRRYLIFLALSVSACLLLVYFLKTPLPRTIAFILVFVTAFLGVSLQSAPSKQNFFQSILVMLYFGGAMLLLSYQIVSFNYMPIEDWKGAAQFIDRKFAPTTEIHAPFRSQNLRIYLEQEFKFVKTLDPERISSGEQIAVDSNFRRKGPLVNDYKDSKIEAVEIRQKRGQFQKIYFAENTPLR